VPVHQGKTIPTGTLRAILRDADISVDEFLELL
jgi:predicted RNA binding protein YcfA (HicA-like mRNA interferase family)